MEIKDALVSSSVSVSPVPNQEVGTVNTKPKRGRPRKTDIEAKKKRSVVGRPPGEAARIREFHARLLTTKGDTIIQTIINKALDPADKDQAAMLKMCVDRLLPMSYFEKGKDGSTKAGITINISGITGASVSADEEQIIEAEDVDYNES